MKRVSIAGATGYLGRYLCAEYQRRGWYVIALVRKVPQGTPIAADQLVEAQATEALTLRGTMAGADLVVSCLGITRQTDGLSYWEVDYQANLNLLQEAEREGASRFAYVHVLNADMMRQVPLVAAKAAFVDALQASRIPSTVIAPSGYFSDMGDVFAMARSGRAWLFGSGQVRINPIHGADLATAVAEATNAGRDWIDVGGPETFTQTEIAQLAFAALERPARVIYLPDGLRRLALAVLPWTTPRRIHGPAQFFLTALAHDMIGQAHGTRRLSEHFQHLASGIDNTLSRRVKP